MGTKRTIKAHDKLANRYKSYFGSYSSGHCCVIVPFLFLFIRAKSTNCVLLHVIFFTFVLLAANISWRLFLFLAENKSMHSLLVLEKSLVSKIREKIRKLSACHFVNSRVNNRKTRKNWIYSGFRVNRLLSGKARKKIQSTTNEGKPKIKNKIFALRLNEKKKNHLCTEHFTKSNWSNWKLAKLFVGKTI